MAFEHALSLADLKVGSAACVQLQGEPICVVRVDLDTVKAVHNTCSHAQYDLHEGWVEDSAIECGLHGSTFDLDTGMPQSLPAVKPIPTYAVRIDGEDVLIDASTPTNDAPVPKH
ncbi:MAG TPA: non-heme iron oxygenase ferredoxin subunit [Euzebya sp.]|nr:non-heme iron oxygenase ferredoxin subunit [Euzebya sp.]